MLGADVSTLIGVSPVTALASPDAVGLWQNTDEYEADDLMVMTGTRRTFNQRNYGRGLSGRIRLSECDRRQVARLEGQSEVSATQINGSPVSTTMPTADG